MLTKNGETIAPTAVAPATMPTCCPEKCSDCESHVPRVTYQAPQMKYCRNIMVLSRTLSCILIWSIHPFTFWSSLFVVTGESETSVHTPPSAWLLSMASMRQSTRRASSKVQTAAGLAESCASERIHA